MKTVVLRIEPEEGGGYPVSLYVDDGAEPRWFEKPLAREHIPLDLGIATPPKDQETGEPLDGHSVLELFLTRKDASQVFTAIGQYLFHLVFRGEIATHWKQLRLQKVPPGRVQLRVILDIVPEHLRKLPLELLSDGPSKLFLDRSLVMLRGSIDFSQRAPVPREWPLRVLIVVGCKQEDERIDWKRELESIEDSFRELRHAVDYEVLHQPSRQRLLQKYFDMYSDDSGYSPHVFHFIGHGYKEDEQQEVGLELWTEEEGRTTRWTWPAEAIMNDLSRTPPRLAVLNACHSSGSSDSARFWPLTRAFIELGTAAVVGMQSEIPGPDAATFAEALYQALVEGLPLDQAVLRARHLVHGRENDGFRRREWALPTTWFSVLPEDVLPLTPCNSELLQGFRQSSEFKQIRDFIDRKNERRYAIGAVEPAAKLSADEPPHLLVIVGEQKVGKTALVYWCLEGCAHHPHRLAYVDLRGLTTKDFVDVLRSIRDGTEGSASPIRKPLAKEAFRTFNWSLNHLLLGKEPPPEPPGLVDDEKQPFEPNKAAEHAIPRIFHTFRTALREAGREPPLILALDHLSGTYLDFFKRYIRPQLIEPIARGELDPVRMILAVTETEYAELELEQLPHTKVPLSRFRREEFLELASEFMRSRMPDEQRRKSFLQALYEYDERLRSDWDTTVLEWMGAILPRQERRGPVR